MSQSANGSVKREAREGWPHPDFNDNRNKVPWEVLEPYQGQRVAFNWEGTHIVASGQDDEEVYAELERLGIDTSKVVFDYIDPLN